MSEKHSIASKARWADVTSEERSKIMRKRVQSRWSKMTAAERSRFMKEQWRRAKMKNANI